ncbi:hypothetical protein [Bacillus pinisoli]|uniref:hypothetical protein n=1 Tax=Bacillus pinisoli TaxID=2901866 RepID=UPI001FF48B7A|nr:hypothetical protein [Bacillus pinisoli]
MLTLADVLKECPLQRGVSLEEIGFKIVYLDPTLSVDKGLFVPLLPDEKMNSNHLKTALNNGAIASLWNKEHALPSFLPTHFPVFLVEDPCESLEIIVKNYIHSFVLKGTNTVDTKFSFSMINKHIDENMSYSRHVSDKISELKENMEAITPKQSFDMKGGEEE